MWSHSPHHTYARCGEILDLSTSFIWRYLKILPMWRNIRFLHITQRNLKFLHMANFFFTNMLVALETNIRYGSIPLCYYWYSTGILVYPYIKCVVKIDITIPYNVIIEDRIHTTISLTRKIYSNVW